MDADAADLWAVAPGVAVTDDGDRIAVLVPSRPTQAPVILQGSAAALWRILPATAATLDAVCVQHHLPAGTGGTFLADLAAAGAVTRLTGQRPKTTTLP